MEIEEGKFVLQADFERELTARSVVLYSDFTRMVQSRASEFFHLVGGDMKKSDDLSLVLVSAVDEMLHNYATIKNFM